MSLYRQAGRTSARVVAIAAAVALVVGLGAGFALGRGTARKPTLADNVTDLRAQLRPAQNGIELTATEYRQAVRGGRVVAPTEYAAARADVKRAADAVADVRGDLRALDPSRAAALERAVAALGGAVIRRAEPATVRRLSDTAGAALRAAAGGP
jgi:hypothetical protein